jgi:prepilin-type processing-associated H-X9-DG protein
VQYALDFHDAFPGGYTSQPCKELSYTIASDTNITPTNPRGILMLGCLYDDKLMANGKSWYCPSLKAGQGLSFEYNGNTNCWPPGSIPNCSTRSAYSVRPIKNTFTNTNVTYWETIGAPHVLSPARKLQSFKGRAIIADTVRFSSDMLYRHRDGVNVGFADGSAHWVPKAKFTANLKLIELITGGTDVTNASVNPYVLDDTEVTSGIWVDYDHTY